MPFFTSGIDWSEAACRGMDVEDFYFTESRRIPITDKNDANMKVRPVCLSCPIWEKCLSWAFDHEEHGVWGGLSAMERNAFRRGAIHEIRSDLLQTLLQHGITVEKIRSLT